MDDIVYHFSTGGPVSYALIQAEAKLRPVILKRALRIAKKAKRCSATETDVRLATRGILRRLGEIK